MSSPPLGQENTSLHLAPADASNDLFGYDNFSAGIPRRLMRVKVLYTFDDQNKSNCLARLPNVLDIPTVSIDETTQVGVIELKTCVQAIVTASPELVAKLGHDYTVYAYDYSEYETPLVGQGMLSWILASASPTPNAPAHQSQTMVTGRVCKNILGLFSNGIKETLEVKLKLVPVPTCLQSEYVDNMERYRSLSKTIPEGFNYGEWADFLKANPTLGRLALTPTAESVQGTYDFGGGVESIHEMLTRPTHSDGYRGNTYHSDLQGRPSSAQESRASSPALSLHSYATKQQTPLDNGSRPASRASARSEQPLGVQNSSISSTFQDHLTEAPPRKRARVTQVRRPTKSSFGTASDSLRVTASTAASVRLHRPAPPNSAATIATTEQVPRAPTPRPNHFGIPSQRSRVPLTVPTSLRRGSTEGHERYVSPYMDAGLYSDNPCDSADDERGVSAGETPMEMPSSPPLVPHCIPPSVPSSPGLPTLPYQNDSGFASDAALSRGENDGSTGKMAINSDLSLAGQTRERRKPDRSHKPWTAVTPGPMELLPKTRRPPLFAHSDSTPCFTAQGNDDMLGSEKNFHEEHRADVVDITKEPEEEISQNEKKQVTNAQSTTRHAIVPVAEAENNKIIPTSEPLPAPARRTSTAKSSRPRALPKSQTWSGEGAREFFSDTAAVVDVNPTPLPQPRSGSGAKRRLNIKGKLEARLAAGKMPEFCNNCGEIETPTWRKAYTRLEMGSPTDIDLSTDGTGIVGFEIIKGGEGEDAQYRVFKQSLEPEERVSESFQTLQLCNPCGLWFNKKGSMRPPEIWMKNVNPDKPKRKRNANRDRTSRKKPNCQGDDLGTVTHNMTTSSIFTSKEVSDNASCHNGTRDMSLPLSGVALPCSSIRNSAPAGQMNEVAAAAALQRAIQSSPVGLAGSKHSPIELDKDLTPKPTRRLLFPSPRKDGEVKSLSDSGKTNTSKSSLEKGRKHDMTGPICDASIEDDDKENCPPTRPEEDDGLAHLFEDTETDVLLATPSRAATGYDRLRTPTPKSKQSLRLNRSTDPQLEHLDLATPTRSAKSTVPGAHTPLTAHLFDFSPSRGIDLSAFGSLDTPGRPETHQTYDYSEDLLSSDLPLLSSSPGNFFQLYVDPATSTAGLWSENAIFDSQAMDLSPLDKNGPVLGEDSCIGTDATVDFGPMIQEVVGAKVGTGAEARTDSFATVGDKVK